MRLTPLSYKLICCSFNSTHLCFPDGAVLMRTPSKTDPLICWAVTKPIKLIRLASIEIVSLDMLIFEIISFSFTDRLIFLSFTRILASNVFTCDSLANVPSASCFVYTLFASAFISIPSLFALISLLIWVTTLLNSSVAIRVAISSLKASTSAMSAGLTWNSLATLPRCNIGIPTRKRPFL
ncbi:ABC transporter permease/ATP-binding protein [Bacillus phage proCM3]|nr:ABC transporter permease/ATP-binding protein [Bacillus phage proCM3]